jgi:hypothetical protein
MRSRWKLERHINETLIQLRMNESVLQALWIGCFLIIRSSMVDKLCVFRLKVASHRTRLRNPVTYETSYYETDSYSTTVPNQPYAII